MASDRILHRRDVPISALVIASEGHDCENERILKLEVFAR